jgi:S1-C subfamily serine protease
MSERKVNTSFRSNSSRGSMLYEDVNIIPSGKIGITLSRGVLGLHILNVKPDSDSYRCGLRKGDAILSINNIPFRSHSQAIRCINNCSEHGREIRFRIVRKPDLRV